MRVGVHNGLPFATICVICCITISLTHAGPVTNQRNLAPCEHSDLPAKLIKDLDRPLVVQASAISVPHPDKVTGSAGKAVNRKKLGWGGEDAYFCSDNV